MPLVFGMIVLVPPQVYLERLYSGRFAGSLPAMAAAGPSASIRRQSELAPSMVLGLRCWCLLSLCFRLSVGAQPSGQAALDRAARLAARASLHWLMPLPLAACILWVAPISRNANGLIGDWYGLAYYGILLLYGAFLFGSRDLLAMLNRQRFLSLGLGIAAYASLYVVFVDGAVRPTIAPADRPAYALVSAVNTMAWLFAIIGFANRHLTRRPVFLVEATRPSTHTTCCTRR